MKSKLLMSFFLLLIFVFSCTSNKSLNAKRKYFAAKRNIKFSLKGNYKIGLITKGEFILKNQKLTSGSLALNLVSALKYLDIVISPPPAFSPLKTGSKVSLSAVLGGPALSGNKKSLSISSNGSLLLAYSKGAAIAFRGFKVKLRKNPLYAFPAAEAVYYYRGKEIGCSGAGTEISVLINNSRYYIRTLKSSFRAKANGNFAPEGSPVRISYFIVREK